MPEVFRKGFRLSSNVRSHPLGSVSRTSEPEIFYFTGAYIDTSNKLHTEVEGLLAGLQAPEFVMGIYVTVLVLLPKGCCKSTA